MVARGRTAGQGSEVTLAQTTTADASYLLLSLVIAAALGLIVGAIGQAKGRSFLLWWLFGTCFFLLALIVVLVIPRQSRPVSAALPPPAITFTNTGQRWQLGYTFADPIWGIWDRREPGPPIERFPFTEQGRTQSLARFAELEPQAAAGPQLPPPPPT
jgi:hypothetical protein